MDEETRKALAGIMDILQNPNEGIKAIIHSCTTSESQIHNIYIHMNTIIEDLQCTTKNVNELKEQIVLNCTKLDKMKENTDLLPDMFEMLKANGNNLEVLSKRLDKVENN